MKTVMAFGCLLLLTSAISRDETIEYIQQFDKNMDNVVTRAELEDGLIESLDTSEITK